MSDNLAKKMFPLKSDATFRRQKSLEKKKKRRIFLSLSLSLSDYYRKTSNQKVFKNISSFFFFIAKNIFLNLKENLFV